MSFLFNVCKMPICFEELRLLGTLEQRNQYYQDFNRARDWFNSQSEVQIPTWQELRTQYAVKHKGK